MTELIEIAADSEGGAAFVARTAIPEGAVVAPIDTTVTRSQPDRYTIQMGRRRHVDADAVRYLNHSCDPNTVIDVARDAVVATRPIAAGEMVTFFYPATEWAMSDPFDCFCGHPDCLGRISGAVAVPGRDLARYRLSDHICELVEERDGLAVPA